MVLRDSERETSIHVAGVSGTGLSDRRSGSYFTGPQRGAGSTHVYSDSKAS
jgi:hypothetical protein